MKIFTFFIIVFCSSFPAYSFPQTINGKIDLSKGWVFKTHDSPNYANSDILMMKIWNPLALIKRGKLRAMKMINTGDKYTISKKQFPKQ